MPMKSFITKLIILSVVVLGTIVAINCIVDPANLLHESVVNDLVAELNRGNTAVSPGDFDEVLFNEKMISSLEQTPETVILGSSHVMYTDWDSVYDDYLIIGLSGANLGDYYSLIGMLDNYDHIPEEIVIGVDSWAFLNDYADGRHSGMGKYAETLHSKIYEEKAPAPSFTNTELRNNLVKARELVSIPYFQTSFRKIIADPSAAFRLQQESIIITDNSISDSESKITPSCKRIMSLDSYETVEEMDMNADYQIDIRSIYSMGLGCDKINAENYKQFTDLVQYLQSLGVNVSFYLPAWYPSLYDFFSTDSDYQFVLQLEDNLKSYASGRNLSVHGSYSPYVCGLSKEDFADFLHIKPDKSLLSFNFTE